jgi:hypothetical protein
MCLGSIRNVRLMLVPTTYASGSSASLLFLVAERYQPVQSSDSTQPLFRCLDGRGDLIPFGAVNDNFCDCLDGSDEPGTSACSHKKGRKFWCKNEGHISAWIWSSRVGDGICGMYISNGSDNMRCGCRLTIKLPWCRLRMLRWFGRELFVFWRDMSQHLHRDRQEI